MSTQRATRADRQETATYTHTKHHRANVCFRPYPSCPHRHESEAGTFTLSKHLRATERFRRSLSSLSGLIVVPLHPIHTTRGESREGTVNHPLLRQKFFPRLGLPLLQTLAWQFRNIGRPVVAGVLLKDVALKPVIFGLLPRLNTGAKL